jgi:hypothetical protein
MASSDERNPEESSTSLDQDTSDLQVIWPQFRRQIISHILSRIPQLASHTQGWAELRQICAPLIPPPIQSARQAGFSLFSTQESIILYCRRDNLPLSVP